MTTNTSSDISIVGDTSNSNSSANNPFSGLQITSYSTVSHSSCFPPQFTGVNSGSGSSNNNNTPSAMSAAAAAAFLLQAAATSGSVNGDGSSNGSLPMRRCSTTSLFESPQASPSFPSSVISAAAQQAALAAAAQAMSAHSSPNSKASSDLQAAVLSLALAANPNTSLQSDSVKYPQSVVDRPNRTSQAVTDLFLLSERHPEILSSHPTLASVFRRRSSTVLPTYLSDLTGNDNMRDHLNDRLPSSSVSMSQSVFSSNLVSALEAMSSQRPATSDLSGSMVTDQSSSIANAGLSSSLLSSSFLADRGRKMSGHDFDSYRFASNEAASDPYSNKLSRHYSPTFDPSMINPRNPSGNGVGLTAGQQDARTTYRNSPQSESNSVSAPYLSYSSCTRNAGQMGQQCVSPSPISHVTDSTPVMCQSNSPLSCSSLSNTATSAVNMSPALPDGTRSRGVAMGSDGMADVKSGFQYASQLRDNCMREHDIKSEYQNPGQYTDEPNRKREQRLMKNREAARECRRKKKEYVRCLEARVSLLESQNQELIEELQKVKALCFNELCGLGLNSSTAACAAAVLAAVTSVSGTYSAAGAPTTSNVKSSQRVSDVSLHISNQVSPTTPVVQVANQHGCSPASAMRPHRTRRPSILSNSKLTPDSGAATVSSTYSSDYSNKVMCDPTRSSSRSYLPEEADIKPSSMSNLPSHTPLVTDMGTEHVSPSSTGTSTVYEPGMDVLDAYRTRNHVPSNPQPPNLGRSAGSHRADPPPFQPHNTPKSSTQILYAPSTQPTPSSTSTSNYYHNHPHYATKRAYRNMSVNASECESGLPDSQAIESGESEREIKSTRGSNSVAGAAVFLAAAAAAMVTESESSNPRISV